MNQFGLRRHRVRARTEEGRFAQDARRDGTGEHGNIGCHFGDLTPMVLMRMRQDDAEERGVGAAQAHDLRQGHDVIARGVEGTAQVQQQPTAPAFQFDARAADLMRTPVDSRSHLESSLAMGW